MLSSLLLEGRVPHAREAVVTRARTVTWEQLQAQAHSMTEAFTALGSRRVGLSSSATSESYAALAALDKLGSDTFLFDAHLSLEGALALARKFRLGAILVPSVDHPFGFSVHELQDEEKASSSSTVTILTSGSTGEPKAARHTWESLFRPVRRGPDGRAPRWLLTYRPNLYAGLQVMLQCFADRGTLAVFDSEMEPSALAQFMSDARVQFVSGTPSFWRRLLIFADSALLKKASLIQITLGGEVVDQTLLDNLKQCFPHARLVHIYATTELGRCFSVHDGIAGFPATYLGKVLADNSELRIKDGELLIRSANSMKMYDPHSDQKALNTDWFATGDLVELKDERVYFAGRRTDMINVAGSKVYPVEVERVIRAIHGVSDVRVFGKSSSVAGELVACEIVPTPGQDPEMLKMRVNQACRSTLSSPQQPRLIKLVDQISLSAAGKALRSKSS